MLFKYEKILIFPTANGNNTEIRTKKQKQTVVVFLVGVGHLFEDRHDLLVGRSALDGVSHGDGHGVAW